MTDRLQRPPGFAPKGTVLGVAGCVGLVLAPLFSTGSLTPVLRDSADLSNDVAIATLVLAFPLAITLALGIRKRRLWFVRFVFTLGVAGLVAFAWSLAIGILVWCRIVPEAHPELRFILYFSMFSWLFFAPMAFWTVRLLRLRYWQPWTRSDQWEPGDEAAPPWAATARRSGSARR